MRKHDELTNPDSCMSRARDDEMTFVLLGRDEAAPATIRFWIQERIRLGKEFRGDVKLTEAEEFAKAMAHDRLTTIYKAPDPDPTIQNLVVKLIRDVSERVMAAKEKFLIEHGADPAKHRLLSFMDRFGGKLEEKVLHDEIIVLVPTRFDEAETIYGLIKKFPSLHIKIYAKDLRE